MLPSGDNRSRAALLGLLSGRQMKKVFHTSPTAPHVATSSDHHAKQRPSEAIMSKATDSQEDAASGSDEPGPKARLSTTLQRSQVTVLKHVTAGHCNRQSLVLEKRFDKHHVMLRS